MLRSLVGSEMCIRDSRWIFSTYSQGGADKKLDGTEMTQQLLLPSIGHGCVDPATVAEHPGSASSTCNTNAWPGKLSALRRCLDRFQPQPPYSALILSLIHI
eukprot:TRINITY_DN37078_c0_g1_i2.p1 TRINITY_DN37078_c0_g1~~TRINITY_DN37078_c0_g1_i2.p1  ORF type:complete len:102 (-),score=9.91 TRINITY_DN37078_c0_g1_i2:81-386(-)